MYTITNNTTNVATNNTAERIARAKYSAEYTALYTRLDEAGKRPWEYRVLSEEWDHPARHAEVSNVHVYNCAGLRSYQKFDFWIEAERILIKFVSNALDGWMPVEDFFHGLRTRLSRIVRTWDHHVRGRLNAFEFFDLLEAMARRLEPDEAERLLKVSWLLDHDILREKWQEAILSLLSPEKGFLEAFEDVCEEVGFLKAFEDAYKEVDSVNATESKEARHARALRNKTALPDVNWMRHSCGMAALYEAAMQWNTVRAFARTKENARAIRAFDRAFSEARKEFADGLYPEALRELKKARCSLAEIF